MDYEPSNNLRQREGIWYMDMRVGGRRVRKSTNTTDHEIAKQFVKRYEATFRGKMLDRDWVEQVERQAATSGSWVKRMYHRIGRRTERSGRVAELSYSEMVGLLLASNGRCAVSGIRFDWLKPEHSRCAPFSPTIDRVDSRLGYVAGNCRVVCLSVNIGMREWGEAVMTKIGLAMLAKKLEHEI
jgi:hypothetical protein